MARAAGSASERTSEGDEVQYWRAQTSYWLGVGRCWLVRAGAGWYWLRWAGGRPMQSRQRYRWPLTARSPPKPISAPGRTVRDQADGGHRFVAALCTRHRRARGQLLEGGKRGRAAGEQRAYNVRAQRRCVFEQRRTSQGRVNGAAARGAECCCAAALQVLCFCLGAAARPEQAAPGRPLRCRSPEGPPSTSSSTSTLTPRPHTYPRPRPRTRTPSET